MICIPSENLFCIAVTLIAYLTGDMNQTGVPLCALGYAKGFKALGGRQRE